MKKKLTVIGLVLLACAVLYGIWWNLPGVRMVRLSQKSYELLRAIPAVRLQYSSREWDPDTDMWYTEESPVNTYWISGEDRCVLGTHDNRLYWEGTAFDIAPGGGWREDPDYSGINLFLDKSWSQLTWDAPGTVQRTEQGTAVRFVGPAGWCCTGYQGTAVVFHFDRKEDLTAVELEYIHYSHAGVSETNITSRHSGFYQITSLDEALVRQELETVANRVLERVYGR